MARLGCLVPKLDALLQALWQQPPDDSHTSSSFLESPSPVNVAPVQQAGAVKVEGVKELELDGNLINEGSDVALSSEAAHQVLEGVWATLRIDSDHLSVKDGLLARQLRLNVRDHVRQAVRHVGQIASVDPDPLP